MRLAGGIVRRWWGPAAGLAAALFLAGNSIIIHHSFRACTDLVFFALFLGTLTLVLRQPSPRPRIWAGAGALAGAAWLTRYTGAVLFPAGLLALVLLVRPRRRMLLSALAFAGAAFLVVAPWSFHLWRLTGDPFWNNNYQNVAIDVYASTPATAQQGRFMARVGFSSLAEVWRVDPPRVLSAFLANATHHVLEDAKQLVGVAWAAAAVPGFFLVFVRRRRRLDAAFAGAGFLTYLGLVPAFYDPRFMIPLLLWWSAGVGVTAAVLGSALRGSPPGEPTGQRDRKRRRRSAPIRTTVLAWAPVMVVLALTVPANLREIRAALDLHQWSASPLELVRLAESARRSGYTFDATTPIAARKPQIGYLLGAPVIPIPLGPLSRLREVGAHYCLVSGIEVSTYPSLEEFYRVSKEKAAAKGLTLVARVAVPVGNGERRLASLFAVNDPLPWKRPAPGPVVAEREVTPGLSRIDTLRQRLATWYTVWDPAQSVGRVLGRMSPEALETPPCFAFAATRPCTGANRRKPIRSTGSPPHGTPPTSRSSYGWPGPPTWGSATRTTLGLWQSMPPKVTRTAGDPSGSGSSWATACARSATTPPRWPRWPEASSWVGRAIRRS